MAGPGYINLFLDRNVFFSRLLRSLGRSALSPDEKKIILKAHLATMRRINVTYDLLPCESSILALSTVAKKPDPKLNKYLGTYSDWEGEQAVFLRGNGLAVMGLPTMNPVKSVVKLKKTGENTFRRVRDDEELGEEIVFEIGPDGRASRLKRHSNSFPRVR